MPQPKLRPRDVTAQKRLSEALGQIGFAMPGSIVERHARCGKASCRCKADPPQLHGPYFQWTRKIAGKTVTRNLTPEQFARYQPWFDNARRLRQIAADMEALALGVAERTERWDPPS